MSHCNFDSVDLDSMAQCTEEMQLSTTCAITLIIMPWQTSLTDHSTHTAKSRPDFLHIIDRQPLQSNPNWNHLLPWSSFQI